VALGVAILMHAINNIANGVPFWHGMGKTMAMSAITAGITAGIGAAANGAFSASTTVGKALFQAGLHGIVGGIMSSLEGGSFESGFAAGAISSLVSSGIGALGETTQTANGITKTVANKFGQSGWFKATMIASAGLSGGLSSSIAGGSFWAGARQGVIVAAMNHLGNHFEGISKKSRLDKEVDAKYGDKADTQAPANTNTVNEVSELPLLKAVRSNSGNQPFTVDSKNEYWPEDGDSKAITVIRSDMKNSDITYFNSSFQSYRTLAQIILHENLHAYFNFKGYYAGLLNNGYSEYKTIKISEYYTYSLCKSYAGTPLYIDFYRGQAFIHGQPMSHFPFLTTKK